MTENEVEYPIIEPDKQKLLQLSSGVQKQFDLELLGIDMIIENATGRYAVIDVNVFPGSPHVICTKLCQLFSCYTENIVDCWLSDTITAHVFYKSFLP